MFAQVGFRDDYRVIASGNVSRRNRSGIVVAYLVQWPGCDEMAWASHTQVVWPADVIVHGSLKVAQGETVPREAAAIWFE